MPGIFISYRRQDSQSAAGRLTACTAVDVLANGNQMQGVVVYAATGERDVLTLHRIQ